MIGRTRECNPVLVHHDVLSLLNLLKSATDDQLVCAMKKIVPEYVSQNSTYERFDEIKLQENKQEKITINFMIEPVPCIDPT